MFRAYTDFIEKKYFWKTMKLLGFFEFLGNDMMWKSVAIRKYHLITNDLLHTECLDEN